ncbi:hypothetical protein GGQ91_002508 [Methylobacterium fujisawaense]|uniref:Secreted protein n=1 Tax=Methylobacterium fujisawaense TaxID=107400 RepID=A0ABR6DAJ7_9HYPH|nr:hypothetical protein [Methylobacterium fujisawaense]MBA9063120.1 hypothetical protein [Methylobacterium fujisawaense]
MLLRIVPLYLAVSLLMWMLAVATGHAETVGFRIEVRACRGADCRLLPVSGRRWLGRFACEGHASTIEQFGEAPRGRTLSARCVAVDGMAGA